MNRKYFHRLPENICRAYEVAETAKFDFILVDLTINQYFKGMFDSNKYLTEIPPPEFNQLLYIQDKSPDINYIFHATGRELLTEVEKRIDKYKIGFEQPFHILSESIKSDNACFSMLKKAVKVFDASFIQIHNCMYLSQAIAALDKAKKIQSNHIAEAIQYSMQNNES